jgi:hypothetical protein
MPPAAETLNADGSGATADRLASIEKRLAAIDELRADVRALGEKLDRRAAAADRRVSIPTAGMAPDAPGSAGGASASQASPAGAMALNQGELADQVVDKIEKRMNEKAAKVAGREYSDDGRWKAPLDELVAELALNETSKGEAKRIFDDVKDRGYALLKLQRLDGGSLLDDYVAALKNGPDAESSTKTFFKRIVNEHVPGTDETYLAAFIEIGQDADRDLAKTLDRPTMAKLRGLRVDLLDVKTGYDPIGDYVRARLQ